MALLALISICLAFVSTSNGQSISIATWNTKQGEGLEDQRFLPTTLTRRVQADIYVFQEVVRHEGLTSLARQMNISTPERDWVMQYRDDGSGYYGMGIIFDENQYKYKSKSHLLKYTIVPHVWFSMEDITGSIAANIDILSVHLKATRRLESDQQKEQGKETRIQQTEAINYIKDHINIVGTTLFIVGDLNEGPREYDPKKPWFAKYWSGAANRITDMTRVCVYKTDYIFFHANPNTWEASRWEQVHQKFTMPNSDHPLIKAKVSPPIPIHTGKKRGWAIQPKPKPISITHMNDELLSQQGTQPAVSVQQIRHGTPHVHVMSDASLADEFNGNSNSNPASQSHRPPPMPQSPASSTIHSTPKANYVDYNYLNYETNEYDRENILNQYYLQQDAVNNDDDIYKYYNKAQHMKPQFANSSHSVFMLLSL
eukprot:109712_1